MAPLPLCVLFILAVSSLWGPRQKAALRYRQTAALISFVLSHVFSIKPGFMLHYLHAALPPPPIHGHARIAFVFPTLKLTWPAKEEAVCFLVLAFAVDF